MPAATVSSTGVEALQKQLRFWGGGWGGWGWLLGLPVAAGSGEAGAQAAESRAGSQGDEDAQAAAARGVNKAPRRASARNQHAANTPHTHTQCRLQAKGGHAAGALHSGLAASGSGRGRHSAQVRGAACAAQQAAAVGTDSTPPQQTRTSEISGLGLAAWRRVAEVSSPRQPGRARLRVVHAAQQAALQRRPQLPRHASRLRRAAIAHRSRRSGVDGWLRCCTLAACAPRRRVPPVRPHCVLRHGTRTKWSHTANQAARPARRAAFETTPEAPPGHLPKLQCRKMVLMQLFVPAASSGAGALSRG